MRVQKCRPHSFDQWIHIWMSIYIYIHESPGIKSQHLIRSRAKAKQRPTNSFHCCMGLKTKEFSWLVFSERFVHGDVVADLMINWFHRNIYILVGVWSVFYAIVATMNKVWIAEWKSTIKRKLKVLIARKKKCTRRDTDTRIQRTKYKLAKFVGQSMHSVCVCCSTVKAHAKDSSRPQIKMKKKKKKKLK